MAFLKTRGNLESIETNYSLPSPIDRKLLLFEVHEKTCECHTIPKRVAYELRYSSSMVAEIFVSLVV